MTDTDLRISFFHRRRIINWINIKTFAISISPWGTFSSCRNYGNVYSIAIFALMFYVQTKIKRTSGTLKESINAEMLQNEEFFTWSGCIRQRRIKVRYTVAEHKVIKSFECSNKVEMKFDDELVVLMHPELSLFLAFPKLILDRHAKNMPLPPGSVLVSLLCCAVYMKMTFEHLTEYLFTNLSKDEKWGCLIFHSVAATALFN